MCATTATDLGQGQPASTPKAAAPQESAPAILDCATAPAAAFVRSAAVTCAPETSVRQVARRMANTGRRVALVRLSPDGALGIVTDSDLRSRVVAEGLSSDAPVCLIMSAPAFVADPARPAVELLAEMSARHIEQMPVVTSSGELLGVVERSDVEHLGRAR